MMESRNPRRIVCFFAAAPNNRVFSKAVAIALLTIRKNYSSEWNKAFKDHTSVMPPLVAMIKAHSSCDYTTVEIDHDIAKKDVPDSILDPTASDEERVRDQAKFIAFSTPLFVACLRSNVCIHCVARDMLDSVSCPELIEAKKGRDDYTIKQLIGKLNSSKNMEVLEAMARIHNKEMHSLNGNIVHNIICAIGEKRADVIHRMTTEAWTQPSLRAGAIDNNDGAYLHEHATEVWEYRS